MQSIAVIVTERTGFERGDDWEKEGVPEMSHDVKNERLIMYEGAAILLFCFF